MNDDDKLMMGLRELVNKMACLNKGKMEDRLKEFKSYEVHYIEYIGKNPDTNVTKMAESFYMTRGAISKMTKKLISRGIIESYQKLDNKKEVYFRLTEQGKKIFDIHEELHKEFQERDKIVFEQITKEQLDNMLCFVDRYSKHLDGEMKKQDISIGQEEI